MAPISIKSMYIFIAFAFPPFDPAFTLQARSIPTG